MINHHGHLLTLADRARADADNISDPALRLLLLQVAAVCSDWARLEALNSSDLEAREGDGGKVEPERGERSRPDIPDPG